MGIEPLINNCKALGHSLPGPHWWSTLNASDQGMWFSGLATSGALCLALFVAFREMVESRGDRKFASKMLAMRMLPLLIEMSRILRRIVKSIEATEPKKRFETFRENIVPWTKMIQDLQPESLKEAFEDRNTSLPKKGSEHLVRAYGLIVSSIKTIGLQSPDEQLERKKFYVLHRLLKVSLIHIDAAKLICESVNKSFHLKGEPSRQSLEEFYAEANISHQPK